MCKFKIDKITYSKSYSRTAYDDSKKKLSHCDLKIYSVNFKMHIGTYQFDKLIFITFTKLSVTRQNFKHTFQMG